MTWLHGFLLCEGYFFPVFASLISPPLDGVGWGGVGVFWLFAKIYTLAWQIYFHHQIKKYELVKTNIEIQ